MIDAADGAIKASYEYSPFGSVTKMAGDLANDNVFRFCTKLFDTETELYYYGYRYYSSELGRWINRDQIEEKGGINVYAFNRNDPIGKVDHYGLAYSPPGEHGVDWDTVLYNRGKVFPQNFEDYLKPLGGYLDSGAQLIKDQFIQFKDRAKHKVQFTYDLRSKIPGMNFGIFQAKFGGVVKVSSDGCCVSVTAGPTVSVVGKSMSLITPAGGINVTGGVNYKYCWYNNEENWSGLIGGTGFLGLRVGPNVWLADAFGEIGVFLTYKYDFSTDDGDYGFGGYARVYFEGNLGSWQYRRQYKYTIGDSDVYF